MGVPGLDIFAAIDLFKDIGYDGIEVRVKEDGQLWPDAYTPDRGKRVRDHLAARELDLCCLTPYFRDFVHPEKCAQELAGFKAVIDMAADLACGIVRSYGGIPAPAGEALMEYWQPTVNGIRECADYAADRNVRIAIETHIGSLTYSATDTVKMVQDVDRPNVGVLFDFAWVDLLRAETAERAVELITPHLFHCHVKDWAIHDRKTGEKTSSLMGEGDVPWEMMLPLIAASGFDGYVSDEYEKYWYDHLPEATVGMRHNLQYMKQVLATP